MAGIYIYNLISNTTYENETYITTKYIRKTYIYIYIYGGRQSHKKRNLVVLAYHFLRDLLYENMRAKMLNGNLYQNLNTRKNDTNISYKYTAMHRLPSASIVPRGFPEGRSCGTLGVDGRQCMGAVRRPSLPFVLHSILRECCVGRWGGCRWTRPTV